VNVSSSATNLMKEKRNFVMPLMKAMAKRFMKNAKMNAHHLQDVENLFHTIINSALAKQINYA
jgi:hypothetical protein